MSTDGFPARTPKEEVAKRVAEGGAGLATAVHGLALCNFAQQSCDHTKRTREGQALGMAALTGTDYEPPEDDSMGDINLTVTGDIYGDDAVERMATGEPVPSTPEEKPQKQQSMITKALPYVLAGLLGASGGVGLPWLLGAFNQSKPQLTQPATDYVETSTSIGIGGGEPTLEW